MPNVSARELDVSNNIFVIFKLSFSVIYNLLIRYNVLHAVRIPSHFENHVRHNYVALNNSNGHYLYQPYILVPCPSHYTDLKIYV